MHDCVECGVQVNAAVQQMQNAASVATRQRAAPSVSARSPGGGRVSTDAPPSSTDSPSHGHRRTSLTSAASQAGEDDVEASAIAERTRMLLLQPSFCERVPSEKLQPQKQRSSLGKSLTTKTASSATPSALQWPSICIDDGVLFTQGHDAEQDQLVECAPPVNCKRVNSPQLLLLRPVGPELFDSLTMVVCSRSIDRTLRFCVLQGDCACHG